MNSRYIIHNKTVAGDPQEIQGLLEDDVEFNYAMTGFFVESFKGNEFGYLDVIKFEKAINYTKWICEDPHPTTEEINGIATSQTQLELVQLPGMRCNPFSATSWIRGMQG